MSWEFELYEINGEGTLHTFTKIVVALTGFEDEAPYTVCVIDLEETGRLLAWFGETIREEDIEISMELQVVPRIFGETEELKVYYSLE